MLSNKEFAAISHVDTPLSGEMELFAMFSIDLGDVMTPVGRDANGKRVLKRANPRLVGKGVHLWDVTPRREGMTKSEFAKWQAAEIEKDRLARLNNYVAAADAARASNGGQLPEEWTPAYGVDDEPEETPADGWDKFFADDVPMTGGRCRRKGGVKDHAGFESLVDG